MDIDLNAFSLKELKDLQGHVSRAIATFEDRQKKGVLAELEELARARGYSFSELTVAAAAKGRRGSGTAAAAKYANPADPAQTWTGRGRKPGWFTAALAAGRRPEDMAL